MKRITVLLLVLVLCLGASATCEEELIGSWIYDYVYMAEQGLITEGELAAYNSGEKALMEFLPDGTLNLYVGEESAYTYTEDRIVLTYTDIALFPTTAGNTHTRTVEFGYVLNGDNLLLIDLPEDTTPPEYRTYLICRRESGEDGLVGHWNVAAQLDAEEYAEYMNGKLQISGQVGLFEFDDNGKCLMWINVISMMEEVSIDSDAYTAPAVFYTTDGEYLTIEIDGDAATARYAFEDGHLVLTVTDSYFDGEDWVNTEEKVFLSRVQ